MEKWMTPYFKAYSSYFHFKKSKSKYFSSCFKNYLQWGEMRKIAKVYPWPRKWDNLLQIKPTEVNLWSQLSDIWRKEILLNYKLSNVNSKISHHSIVLWRGKNVRFDTFCVKFQQFSSFFLIEDSFSSKI